MTNPTRKSDQERKMGGPFDTESHQTAEKRLSETAKQGTMIFPKMSELLQRQNLSPTRRAPSRVLLAEECVFQVVPTTVALLSQSTFKIVVKGDKKVQHLHRHTCLPDMGAGLNLINKAFLKREWLPNIKKQQLPSQRTATEEPISLDGTILLSIQLSNLSSRVWFGVVPNLAVEILPRTLFIDRYIN